MKAPFSADVPRPSPRLKDPLHGRSQTRLRNSRERRERPRIVRISQTRGASPGGGASSPRFKRHARVSGNVSPPPATPAPQRRHRNAQALGDGRQPEPAALNQEARRKEHRRHPEPTPEEANRRRRLTAAAVPAAETETPDALTQGHGKTVRLAGIGRAVQAAAATRAAFQATAPGLRRVNPRQKGPDTGTGKDGTGKEIV